MQFNIKREKKQTKLLDIAPLVDIVFLLLIFFMVSADFMKPVLRLALPVLKTEDNLQKLDIVIAMDKKGILTLNREQITLENLGNALKTEIRNKNQKEIIFQGDMEVTFGNFTKIMDIARQAGAESFSIEHRKKSGGV